MVGYMRRTLKGTSPWPKKTMSVTNKSAKLTPRQSNFAKGLVKIVDNSMNVKNK